MGAPSCRVLRAFGLDETLPVWPLAGGQGTSYRVGDVVLKPIDTDIAVANWSGRLLHDLIGEGFRIARPLMAENGSFVAYDWVASEWVRGEHDGGECWREVIEVARLFHRTVEKVARPTVLDRREDVWARGDRIAWGEAQISGDLGLGRVACEKLRGLLGSDEQVGAQLIHGDLSANVLFAPGLVPAIIDFSPYFRPTSFAEAIILADAIGWRDAPMIGLDLLAGDREQLIIRAVLFRIAAASLFWREQPNRVQATVAGYAPLVKALTGVHLTLV